MVQSLKENGKQYLNKDIWEEITITLSKFLVETVGKLLNNERMTDEDYSMPISPY